MRSAHAVMHRPDVPIEVLEIVSSMLKSDEMGRIWAKHNPSMAQDNKALEVARRIDALIMLEPQFPHLARDHTELLSFMRGFVETELKAARGQNDVETRLDLLGGVLRSILPDEQRLKDKHLPEDCRQVLETVQRQSLQRFQPWQDLKRASGHLVHHFAEIVHDFPVSSKIVAPLMVSGMAWLMWEGMSEKNAPTQLEVAETCATNLSATNVFGGAAFDPGVDEAFCNPNFKSCHDNLRTTFPQTVDYLESRGINIPDLPHCTLVNNLAHNTQGGLLKADEALKGPYYAVMDIMVDRPLEAADDFKLFEGSHFMDGAQKVSKPLQGLIYYLNRGENGLHPILGISMFVYGFAGVFRAKKMTPGEWKEFQEGVVDFTLRAGQTRALNYILPALSVATYLNTHGYDSSGSFVDSNIVALTAIGAATGYVAHRIGAKVTGLNKRHAMRISGDIANQLESLGTAALPFSEQKKAEKIEGRGKIRTKMALWGGAAATYGSVVASDLSGFIDNMPDGNAKELMIQLAEAAGMVPVSAGILGGFLPYNFLIEDPAQHAVFIGGGYSTGTIAGLAVLVPYLAAKYGVQYANKFKDAIIAVSSGKNLSQLPVTPALAPHYIPSKEGMVMADRSAAAAKRLEVADFSLDDLS